MWQCPACEYFNEELDDSCARCSRERITVEPLPEAAAPVAAPDPPVIAEPPPAAAGSPEQASRVQDILSAGRAGNAVAFPQAASSRKSRTPGPLEWAAVAVILLCIAGLGYVGYLVWQRGLLREADGPATSQRGADDATLPLPSEADAADEPAAAGADAQRDPLADLHSGKIAGLREVKRYLTFLTGVEERLAAVAPPFGSSPELSAEDAARLQQLAALGDELIEDYARFEQRAAGAGSRTYQAYVVVRGEYGRMFTAMMQALAGFRAADLDGEHPEYMLSDRLSGALDAGGLISSVPLQDAWVAGLKQRGQALLDRENGEEYRQLAARIAALKELHNKYNDVFRNYEAYTVRGGMIGPEVVRLLGLYDDMATALEELALEFAEYSATLDPDKDSDKRKAYLREFVELAQADHIYCFHETYKIYEKDKLLRDPAYERIEQHFAFVELHWPQRKGAYMQIYTQYENAWEARWHRK